MIRDKTDLRQSDDGKERSYPTKKKSCTDANKRASLSNKNRAVTPRANQNSKLKSQCGNASEKAIATTKKYCKRKKNHFKSPTITAPR